MKPDKTVLRRHRAARPAKLFEREDLLAMIEGKGATDDGGEKMVRADPTLRAMILLGVNCGFGNTDCSELTFAALDLKKGRKASRVPSMRVGWSARAAGTRPTV